MAHLGERHNFCYIFKLPIKRETAANVTKKRPTMRIMIMMKPMMMIPHECFPPFFEDGEGEVRFTDESR